MTNLWLNSCFFFLFLKVFFIHICFSFSDFGRTLHWKPFWNPLKSTSIHRTRRMISVVCIGRFLRRFKNMFSLSNLSLREIICKTFIVFVFKIIRNISPDAWRFVINVHFVCLSIRNLIETPIKWHACCFFPIYRYALCFLEDNNGE